MTINKIRNTNEYFRRRIFFLLVLMTSSGFFVSCNKLLDVDPPPTKLSADLVFNDPATATAVLTDIYARKFGGIDYGFAAISQFTGLSADEFKIHKSVTDQRYLSSFQNNLNATTSFSGEYYWNSSYSIISSLNSAIAFIPESESIPLATKNQLLGEARFLRAFFYFYLVNLFGDVPLNLTADYIKNKSQPRSSTSLVYDQIVTDLEEAQTLLSPDYVNSSMAPTNERTRPNKFTALALLSRVYLYTEDYVKAEETASKVLAHTEIYELSDINEVFNKNSKETIWALQVVGDGPNVNTTEATRFIIDEVHTPSESLIFLNISLVDEFTSNDKRKNWIGLYVDLLDAPVQQFYFPFKYKHKNETTSFEYPIIFRLAEQYLIRAEARANVGNFSGACSDLNSVRERAGLKGTEANDLGTLSTAILTERRLELFSEWGHRWFDLKRLRKANEVLAPLKGVNWQVSDQLYPIPQVEVEANPGIKGHQNPGY